jgi:SnoaL-like domain
MPRAEVVITFTGLVLTRCQKVPIIGGSPTPSERIPLTHSIEALVRDAIAAFSRGDLDALRTQYLADDIRWRFPGQSAFGGDHEGPDQVIALFGKLAELSGGTHRVELHDVLANDDHVVAARHPG